MGRDHTQCESLARKKINLKEKKRKQERESLFAKQGQSTWEGNREDSIKRKRDAKVGMVGPASFFFKL